MQPMTSMQTTLLPGVTPGWNDPPPLGTPSSGGRLNRNRRVVDPSISNGTPAPVYASPQQGIAPPQNGIPPFQQQPQQVQYQQPPMYSMPAAGMGDGPNGYGNNGYPPQTGYGTPSIQPPPIQQQPLQPQSMSPYGHHHHHQSAATMTSSEMPVVYGATTATGYGSPLMAQGGPTTVAPAPPPPSGAYDTYNVAPTLQHPPPQHKLPLEGQGNTNEMTQQYATLSASYPPNTGIQNRPSTGTGSSSFDESSLIFEPPNAVVGREEQRPPTMPDPATYRPPTKAPGDVHLPLNSLIQFLVKAAFRLPVAKCQGVQMKLYSLQQLMENGNVNEQFVMKLNYVVDSIDSERYDEASTFFDQLQQSFPGETTGQWVHGIRLLLQELRRPQSRIGSAASRH